jgi:hypothetical protein
MSAIVPAWAADFDPDQPFEQGVARNLLHSLLDQALDALDDHLEISGTIDPEDAAGSRHGNFRFKFYPEGKSNSDHHLTAEGWFHFSPEAGQQDWHFRFKLPEDRAQRHPLPFEEPL